ncbi:MAG: hypothetical protein IJU73_01195 [Ruminococcus sp.]|nr:hypothetical protein [Ruminococcus sp.]
MNETLTAILSDIGLGKDEIAVAQRLDKAGRSDDLQKYLRLCRCDLMDELHRSQKKIDNLDFLIRTIKGGHTI